MFFFNLYEATTNLCSHILSVYGFLTMDLAFSAHNLIKRIFLIKNRYFIFIEKLLNVSSLSDYWLDCLTTGLSDYYTVGLSVCRIIGLTRSQVTDKLDHIIIALLPFFIEMLQCDWLWSGHMIIKEMLYIPIKLKPEFARASMTTSDVNNQRRSDLNVIISSTRLNRIQTHNFSRHKYWLHR
jgi:hypothetical protein